MYSGRVIPAPEEPSLAVPEHLTKTALAIQALRSAILRGDIATDAPLTVGRIARMLGMSPTPVREAIRTLQAEGLLRHEPHHTVSVMRYSAKDIHDLFQMRADLESQATQLAVSHLTAADLDQLGELNQHMRAALPREDFDLLNQLNGRWHLLIYSAADNHILLDVIQHLWKRFVWDVNWILPNRALRSIEEHEAILEALRAGDAAEAGRRVRTHIQSGEEFAATYVSQPGSASKGQSRQAKNGVMDE